MKKRMQTPRSATQKFAADPYGHTLLRERVAGCRAVVEKMLAMPLPSWPAAARKRPWVVTGIGSSEGHARLLAHEVMRSGGPPAVFRPLGSFLTGQSTDLKERFLVIISQGLSPNCQPAIAAAGNAAGAALFTATTPAGAAAAGKPERARLIERWVAAGHALFPFIPEEEFGVLLRVQGPIAGTVAVLRAAAMLERKAEAPPPGIVDCVAKASRYFTGEALQLIPHLGTPFLLVGSPELTTYGQNLAYKFLEGAFLPQPALVDWLQFAHGAFQQRCAASGPAIALRESTGSDDAAWTRAEPLLRMCCRPLLVHQASLPPPWSLLEHEAALSHLVARLALRLKANQRNWPGIGRDGPLYDWGARTR